MFFDLFLRDKVIPELLLVQKLVVMKQESKPVAKAKPEKKTTQPKESDKEPNEKPKAKYIFKGSTTN